VFLAAEQTGFAVVFGLDPVVGWAEQLVVGVGGHPAVGDGVDVIALEVVAPIAARSGADVAVEIGWRSKLEGGAQHRWIPAAEMGDGVDLGAGVQDRLELTVEVGAQATSSATDAA
jgi:hypothetical protein